MDRKGWGWALRAAGTTRGILWAHTDMGGEAGCSPHGWVRGEEPRVLTGDGGEAHGGTVEARLREWHSSMGLFPSWPTAP